MQGVNELKDVISTSDATIQGILISVCIALAVAVSYLFKKLMSTINNSIEQSKEYSDALLKVNNSYHEFVRNMVSLKEK